MININKVKRYSVKTRFSKVNLDDFAKPPCEGRSFAKFFDTLPNILNQARYVSSRMQFAGKEKEEISNIHVRGACHQMRVQSGIDRVNEEKNNYLCLFERRRDNT